MDSKKIANHVEFLHFRKLSDFMFLTQIRKKFTVFGTNAISKQITFSEEFAKISILSKVYRKHIGEPIGEPIRDPTGSWHTLSKKSLDLRINEINLNNLNNFSIVSLNN